MPALTLGLKIQPVFIFWFATKLQEEKIKIWDEKDAGIITLGSKDFTTKLKVCALE